MEIQSEQVKSPSVNNHGFQTCSFGVGKPIPNTSKQFLYQPSFFYTTTRKCGVLPIRSSNWTPYNKYYVKPTNRFETFNFWPHNSTLSKYDMVNAGFYYTGVKDIVTCFHCGISIEDWSSVTDSKREHKKHSPNCNFMKMVKEDLMFNELLPPDYYRYIGMDCIDTEPELEREWVPINIPMCEFKKRYDTFHSWPIQIRQKPRDMALGGFYYTGEGDKVTCFHCGIMVLKWESTDVIQREHKKHSPLCKFVHMTYGI